MPSPTGHHFCTLGAFPFYSREIEIGPLPRNITVATNALAVEPVQVNAYIAGYMGVRIDAFLLGVDTQNETAQEHLARQRSNLKTEVAKDTNTLLIDWRGGSQETYRVFKNEDYALVFATHVQRSHLIDFSLTLNCLP